MILLNSSFKSLFNHERASDAPEQGTVRGTVHEINRIYFKYIDFNIKYLLAYRHLTTKKKEKKRNVCPNVCIIKIISMFKCTSNENPNVYYLTSKAYTVG